MSRGNDPDVDRLRGACAGVGEQGMVLCAVPSRYLRGGVIELDASAETSRREGDIAPYEGVFAARGGQRR